MYQSRVTCQDCIASPLGLFVIAVLVSCGRLNLSFADEPKSYPANSGVVADKHPQNDLIRESIEVRYARAHWELAKSDLSRALAMNERIPDLFSERELDSLRKHVAIDQEQLNQLLQGHAYNVHEIFLRTAESTLGICKAEVARKQHAYKKSPDHYSSLALDQAKAQLKVAELNVERTRLQKDSISTISYLQWQIDELRNQLLETQLKLDKVMRQ